MEYIYILCFDVEDVSRQKNNNKKKLNEKFLGIYMKYTNYSYKNK